MKIRDENNILRQIAEQAIREPGREHCVLATAEQIDMDTYSLFDSCNAEDIGGTGEAFCFNIPAKVSMALLNICQRERIIPVVIHTHPYHGIDSCSVRFSEGDISYNDHFTEYAAEKGIPCCLFIVTDGVTIMYCSRTLHNMLYTFEEGKVSDLVEQS